MTLKARNVIESINIWGVQFDLLENKLDDYISINIRTYTEFIDQYTIIKFRTQYSAL